MFKQSKRARRKLRAPKSGQTFWRIWGVWIRPDNHDYWRSRAPLAMQDLTYGKGSHQLVQHGEHLLHVWIRSHLVGGGLSSKGKKRHASWFAGSLPRFPEVPDAMVKPEWRLHQYDGYYGTYRAAKRAFDHMLANHAADVFVFLKTHHDLRENARDVLEEEGHWIDDPQGETAP